jgi:hypothetical protein
MQQRATRRGQVRDRRGLHARRVALWVHLDDVYWSERGRISFDAVVCTCAFAALVVIGTRPFGLDDPGSIWGTALVVLVFIGLTTACFAKGRVLFGVIGGR